MANRSDAVLNDILHTIDYRHIIKRYFNRKATSRFMFDIVGLPIVIIIILIMSSNLIHRLLISHFDLSLPNRSIFL